MRSGTILGHCSLFLVIGSAPASVAAPPQTLLRSPLLVDRDSVGVGVVLTMDDEGLAVLSAQSHVTLVDFALSADHRVTLELSRAQAFAPYARIVIMEDSGAWEAPLPELTLFGGSVVGDPDSRVFLSFTDGHAEGFVQTSEGVYLLSSGSAAAPQPTRIFALSEAPEDMIDLSGLTCSADDLPRIARTRAHGGGTRGGGPPCRVADIAVETDWEYRQLLGGSTPATNYVGTLIGAVSEIFKRDVNCRLQVSFLRIWNTSNDPWTENGGTVDQLFQFQDYWNDNMTGEIRNAAHFLSGRGLGGGVAYLPGLCADDYDYGLSANLGGSFPYPIQNNSSQNWDLMVVAHELGHNFGAPHTHDMSPPIDGCASGNCSVVPNGTIMSYCHLCSGGLANVRMEMHSRTINEAILPFLADPGTIAACDLADSGTNITGHPSSASRCPGTSVTFSVTATGTGLTYQWRRNTVNIGGATASSYTDSNVQAGDAGSYDCVVNSSCGPTTSNAATLTVLSTVSINGHPNNASICPGSPVTFTVSATGSGLTYQWRRNTTNIGGATASSYTDSNVQAGDAGAYDCVVTGTCSSATSNSATLTVLSGVSIISQPGSASICPGDPVTFTVGATGSGLTYQWRKNTTNIGGATASSYTDSNVQAGDAGAYDCVITGTCGSATSSAATLTVLSDVAIADQPDPVTVCPGDPAAFSVTATGSGLTYQWRRNTINIGGATASTLNIAAAGAGDVGNYDVVITATCSSVTSNSVALALQSDVQITDAPDSATVCEGSNVTFSVSATGSGLTYQWRKNSIDIGGATGSSHNIPAAGAGDAGSYDVVVTGTCGTETSSAAMLTVCASDVLGDLDSDCDVDLEDLSVQLANFGVSSGATYEQGDLSGDGAIDIEDVSLMLATYGTSCL